MKDLLLTPHSFLLTLCGAETDFLYTWSLENLLSPASPPRSPVCLSEGMLAAAAEAAAAAAASALPAIAAVVVSALMSRIYSTPNDVDGKGTERKNRTHRAAVDQVAATIADALGGGGKERLQGCGGGQPPPNCNHLDRSNFQSNL